MRLWIQNFMGKYIDDWYFPSIHFTDILEILIITVIVYEIMLWIKNTKAWMLLRGLLTLGAFILVAAIFKMHTILLQKRQLMFWRWQQWLYSSRN